MNEGRLSPEALRGWVANRFYYQRNIPIKDAAILSNCPLREVRRLWLHRIIDHDGIAPGADDGDEVQGESEGGIEAWLRLGAACGLSRDELWQNRHVEPGVRFAVDAYVTFARTQPWPVAIASSLTELFAPDLMSARLAAFEKFYRWIDSAGSRLFSPPNYAGPARFRRRHSRSRWNTATRASCKRRRSTRCNSNATCSGQFSMRSNCVTDERPRPEPASQSRARRAPANRPRHRTKRSALS